MTMETATQLADALVQLTWEEWEIVKARVDAIKEEALCDELVDYEKATHDSSSCHECEESAMEEIFTGLRNEISELTAALMYRLIEENRESEV